MINPFCDMPEWAYKDYLADQGYDELRDIDFASLVTGIYLPLERGIHHNDWCSGDNQSILASGLFTIDYDEITHAHNCCYGSSWDYDAAELLLNDIVRMRSQCGDGWISSCV